MHAPSDNRYSSSIVSGEAMHTRVLERTIRRLEKLVRTLTTTLLSISLTVDGSLVATGVHDMLRTALILMGERKIENLGGPNLSIPNC